MKNSLQYYGYDYIAKQFKPLDVDFEQRKTTPIPIYNETGSGSVLLKNNSSFIVTNLNIQLASVIDATFEYVITREYEVIPTIGLTLLTAYNEVVNPFPELMPGEGIVITLKVASQYDCDSFTGDKNKCELDVAYYQSYFSFYNLGNYFQFSELFQAATTFDVKGVESGSVTSIIEYAPVIKGNGIAYFHHNGDQIVSNISSKSLSTGVSLFMHAITFPSNEQQFLFKMDLSAGNVCGFGITTERVPYLYLNSAYLFCKTPLLDVESSHTFGVSFPVEVGDSFIITIDGVEQEFETDASVYTKYSCTQLLVTNRLPGSQSVTGFSLGKTTVDGTDRQFYGEVSDLLYYLEYKDISFHQNITSKF